MIIIRPYIKKIWSLKNKRLKKHIVKINRFIGKSEHQPISIILLEYAWRLRFKLIRLYVIKREDFMDDYTILFHTNRVSII